jgi:hypothetical protein
MHFLQIGKLVQTEESEFETNVNATNLETVKEMEANKTSISTLEETEKTTAATTTTTQATVTDKVPEKLCKPCPTARTCLPPAPVMMLEKQVRRLSGQVEECDKQLQVKILKKKFFCSKNSVPLF